MKRPAINTVEQEALLAKAKEAAGRAYAPYSNYAVGAAVLTADGTVYTGANVESAAYGDSLCAERVAVAAAVSSGSRDLAALAVAAADGSAITPCGACRQVIVEFSPSCQVIMDGKDGPRAVPASELLPDAFKWDRSIF